MCYEFINDLSSPFPPKHKFRRGQALLPVLFIVNIASHWNIPGYSMSLMNTYLNE